MKMTSVLVACLTLLTGCYNISGPGWSADQHAYESTTWQPYTITLLDLRTEQAFWSYEVPVGRKLVINFNAGQGTEDEFTPDLMMWEEMAPSRNYGTLKNQLPVPPAVARRIDVMLRESPELPSDMIVPTAPAGTARRSDPLRDVLIIVEDEDDLR